MYGPPGTGKTLLARAVAHHTDCTFIRVSGSELVQKYIGEGSRMVRELFVMARFARPFPFNMAYIYIYTTVHATISHFLSQRTNLSHLPKLDRQHSPSIIFMDEIDSIGSSRGKSSRGDSEVQRTMMELLNQLDGFEPSNKIKVVCIVSVVRELELCEGRFGMHCWANGAAAMTSTFVSR